MEDKLRYSEGSKLSSIQALRTCAFLGIFSSHAGTSSLGGWGVSIFLILSGFIMFYAYKDRDIKCSIDNNILFSIRKIKKLYLLHILTMILSLLLDIYMYFEYIAPNNVIDMYERVALNVFLVQSWMPENSIFFSLNGVAWYLSTCVFLYFMFPYIIKKVKKCNYSVCDCVIRVALTLCIQTVVALILYKLNATEEITKWFVFILPLYRLGDFYIGIIVGYIFFNYINTKESYNTSKFFIFIITIFECTSVALTVLVQRIHVKSIGILGTMYFKLTLLYTLLSVMIVLLCALNKGVISKILTNKFMIYVGELSGFAFLIHFVVIKYYNEFLSNRWMILSYSWVRFGICLVATIFISHIWSNISKIYTEK
jgi:hypothetical protein